MELRTLDLVDAALRLQCPYSKAYRYVLTGRLDGTRFNGRWKITKESIERLAQELVEETPVPVA